MKRYTLAIVLAAAACAHPARTPAVQQAHRPLGWHLPALPRFIVAGQSNGISRAYSHAPAWSRTGTVVINDYYHDYGPGWFFVPSPAWPSMAGVSWVLLGDWMERPALFDIVAEGGTDTSQWRAELHSRIELALAYTRYDAVLWVQGESDIGNGLTEEMTYQNLKFVIEESRKVQPLIPWFVALDSMTGQSDDNRTRRAEKRVIAEGLAYEGPDLDPLHNSVEYSGGIAGSGEFIGAGLEEHARLWWEVLR